MASRLAGMDLCFHPIVFEKTKKFGFPSLVLLPLVSTRPKLKARMKNEEGRFFL